MNQKKFVATIKGGLVGTFALSGLCICFVIVSQGSPKAISVIEAIFKTVPSIPGLFLLIGGIGFILGIILKQVFPKIQNGMLPLFLSFLMFAMPLGFVAWLYYNAAHHMEIPPSNVTTNGVNNISK